MGGVLANVRLSCPHFPQQVHYQIYHLINLPQIVNHQNRRNVESLINLQKANRSLINLQKANQRKVKVRFSPNLQNLKQRTVTSQNLPSQMKRRKSTERSTLDYDSYDVL